MRFSPQAVIGWLRAGYPHGVPTQDYIALFGVLQRTLTDEEVDRVTARIIRAQAPGEVTDEEIRRQAHDLLKGAPTEEDVRRVAARLAAGGWPLAHGAGADTGTLDETA